jgi:hypothetical protein
MSMNIKQGYTWQHAAYDIRYNTAGHTYVRILGDICTQEILPLFMKDLLEFKESYDKSGPTYACLLYEMVYIPTDMSSLDSQLFAFKEYTHCAIVCDHNDHERLRLIMDTFATLNRDNNTLMNYFPRLEDAKIWLKGFDILRVIP